MIMLVGNKVDICNGDPSKRTVSKSEGQSLAESNSAIFEETSATENINVKSVFEELMESNKNITIEIYDSHENGVKIDEPLGERLGRARTESNSCTC